MSTIHPDKTTSFWFDIILIGIFGLVSVTAVKKIVIHIFNQHYSVITVLCVFALFVSVRSILRLSSGIKGYRK